MDHQKLADLLFPDVTETPEEMEKRYPPRDLPEGAKVTRFAPSPTGFVHFGGLFPTRVGERLAHQSGGVFYLRIEDTDAKREVPGAAEALIRTLAAYGVAFDEGPVIGGEKGDYGPYRQRQRAAIYHVFAKRLVEEGKAYPCFASEEELNRIRQEQMALKVNPGYYGKWAIWRDRPLEEIEARVKAGEPFVLRFRSEGSSENKIRFTDLVKGDLELTENDCDHVLLKSDGIPTYHFAHAVDDHLMRTTHVIRGEEWLPSLPFHIQLFRALGFKLPKYIHIAQLMKMEGGSKKKLSKRDKGTDMEYYRREGYSPDSVVEYVMTLLNSNYEEWHAQNPDKKWSDFPFSLKKMSPSGCLFDFDKLNDVSKNVVSRMTAREVTDAVSAWAKDFSPELSRELSADPAYAERIFAIGRGGTKPRKDFAVWSEVESQFGYFWDRFYRPGTYPEGYDPALIAQILDAYLSLYDPTDEQTVWFDKIKDLSERFGFARETKEYKKNPDAYKGSVGTVSAFLRVALTGRQTSPDLFEVMRVLGCGRVRERIAREAARLKGADNG